MAWKTPKTDWTAADVLVPKDFNRIEGNTLDNHERLNNHASDISSIYSTLVNHNSRISSNTNRLNGHDSNISSINSTLSNHNIRISSNTNRLNNIEDGSSLALGQGASAVTSSVALGYNASAGTYSVALGRGASATGLSSVALGYNASTGTYSVALGDNASTETSSVALGYDASAGNYAVAIGYDASAAVSSVALGRGASATRDNSVALGHNASTKDYAVAIGYDASAAVSSVALGRGASATTGYSFAIGTNASAGNGSIALGRNTSAGICSVAIGNHASAQNNNEGILGSTASFTTSKWIVPGSFTVNGTKNFEIPHPRPDKKATHRIRHGAVESPTAGDTLYRWKITATKDNDIVAIDLPDYFIWLNKDVQIWVTGQGHFGNGYGVLNRETEQLEIHCQYEGEYNVLVIGTRNDDHESVQNWSIKGVEREIGESWTGETYAFSVDEILEVEEIKEVSA